MSAMRCARRIVRRALPPDDGTLLSDLPPLLRRLYLARGVRTAQELDMSLDRLLPPQSLGQTAAAAKLLHEVLAAGGRILIAADFDADGATSCALAVSALRAMGAAQVGYLVPSRFAYGYGLSPRLVDTLADSPPDLLITVDNGISSVQGVSRARELGIRTLVTDHHLPGATLPEADVIVNPNFPGDPFPSKHLAGVGVIFYVILALRARLREAGWFAQRRLSEPNMADYLDLVALGTVADVVALDQNNRVLVEQGLRRIRAGKCSQGIAALLRVGGRNQSQTSASDLGFVVGPRLNAAGRLEDMGVGIECLLSEDPRRALQLAAILDELNRRRRDIESDMQTEALAQLDGLDGLIGERAAGPPAALCIYREHWHQGVVGILAARVRERYHRPVIAFAPGEHGVLRGSARSVPGLNIRDALEAVSTRNPGLIPQFGGHAMAAGLSLAQGDFLRFQGLFADEVDQRLGGAQGIADILTDGPIAAAEINVATARQLRDAGPWGSGFSEPRFDGLFRVADCRLLAGDHLKLRVVPEDGEQAVDAIAFRQAESLGGKRPEQVRLVFGLDLNDYRGQQSAQLLVDLLEPE